VRASAHTFGTLAPTPQRACGAGGEFGVWWLFPPDTQRARERQAVGAGITKFLGVKMNKDFLAYSIDESLDNMFVTDKRGILFFFPWGSRKKGYRLENKQLKPKIKKFYSTSLTIFFVTLALSFILKQDIWFIFGGILGSTLGWLLVWYLYSKGIAKSLPVSNASYSENCS
jgi:hypothetical protein